MQSAHTPVCFPGLANPAPIIRTFYLEPDIADELYIDAVVTLVDAKHAERHINEVKPDGVVNEAVEQIAYADRIILNKVRKRSDKKFRRSIYGLSPRYLLAKERGVQSWSSFLRDSGMSAGGKVEAFEPIVHAGQEPLSYGIEYIGFPRKRVCSRAR